MVEDVKLRENEVEAVLEKIRPALALDQGNIKLIKVDGNIVYLELLGSCSTCPVPEITMNDVIIATLKHLLPWVKTVYIGQHKFDIHRRI
ncbi:MAG: NifU family protein [Persephonella sp.]|nr:MAG: NifU family protein [Persephonella sp.]RUM61350.1 MAG: NifU family protein [Persephonella sp.]